MKNRDPATEQTEAPPGCGPLGVIAVAEAIKNNGALTSLNISNNSLGEIAQGPLPEGWKSKDDDDEAIRDPERLETIRRHLVEELDDPDDYPQIVTRHTPRQLKHFKVPTEVVIEQDPANERTMLARLTIE